ncbi:MAG: hypothetical protein GX631_04955, partial [Dehalococcoidales bacterium]|nr:hypothetical protein [Dehalococcoidales bacterium]
MAETYKFLNPVGYQEPVTMKTLAPRLKTLDGARITLSIGAGGEQGILIPLSKMLPERYPQVKWNISYAAAHGTKAGSLALAEDEFGQT